MNDNNSITINEKELEYNLKDGKPNDSIVEWLEDYFEKYNEMPIFHNIKTLSSNEKHIYNFIIRYQRDPSFLRQELRKRMEKLPIPKDRKIIKRNRINPRVYGDLKRQKILELVDFYGKNKRIPTKEDDIYVFFKKIKLHNIMLSKEKVKILKRLLIAIGDTYYFSAYKEFESIKEYIETESKRRNKEEEIINIFSISDEKTDGICQLYQEPFDVKNFLIYSNLIIGLKNNMIYVTKDQRRALKKAGMDLEESDIIKKNILENHDKLEDFLILKEILINGKEDKVKTLKKEPKKY